MASSAQLSTRAVLCPHPERRERHTIELDGGRGPMQLCLLCYQSIGAMIRQWHQHQIGAREVSARMQGLGYTRRDAAQMVLQLLADRLKIRLGFAEREDLIGG